MNTYKRYALSATICTVITIGVLLLCDPRSLPSIVLFAVFLLLYCNVVLIFVTFLATVNIFIEKKWQTSMIWRVACSVALLPIFLLSLQSVGQLTARDALLATALAVLVFLYTRRMFGTGS